MTLDAKIKRQIAPTGDHWIWTGPTNYGNPNGQPKFGGKYVREEIWREYREDAPIVGVPIKTSCGTARCVHPQHMTQDKNAPTSDRTTIELLTNIDTKLDLIIQHLGIDPFGGNHGD